jgi:nitroreductase
MEIIEAIKARRSIRGYKAEPVPKKVLQEIVEACQWAGSPGNMQPWEFAIIGGDMMKEFKKRLAEKTDAKAPAELPFPSPLNVPEVYNQRRTVYYRENFDRYVYPPGTDNVEEKKRAHFEKGARLFDAPNAIIVYSDKAFLNIPWGIVSLGIMIQNVCLAALEHGLGTCVMGRLVDYPNMLREMLGVDQSKFFLIGIAIGYPDLADKANNVPRIRIPMEEWVHWYGF